MKTTIKTALLVASLAGSSFAAGYVLPNGTILYDGSPDQTVYKIDKMSPSSSQPVTAPEQTFTPVETTRVVIEDRPVVYDRPVYIRERYIGANPVYDVVDAVGTVLVFGLIYDVARHGFYHHELHRNMRYHRYMR
jgi:hypothetical protein